MVHIVGRLQSDHGQGKYYLLVLNMHLLVPAVTFKSRGFQVIAGLIQQKI